MKVGVGIVWCRKFSKYLDAVKKCFEGYDRMFTLEANFKEIPEETARNSVLQALGDCDYIFLVDADEFLLKEDQKKILEAVVKGGYDVAICKVIDYMTENTAISPQRSGGPIVLCKPSGSFYDGRCGRFTKALYVDVNMHHFGYLYPEDIRKWKAENYWNKDNPKDYANTLKMPTSPAIIPEEIKEYLKYSDTPKDENNIISLNAGAKSNDSRRRTNYKNLKET